MSGRFYGVGVGPGDPELVTLRARKVLQEARVVFVPHGRAEGDSLALEAARPHLSPTCRVERLFMPMRRGREELRPFWREAAARVAAELDGGQTAAFLTLGDPLLYSTYVYLLRELRRLQPAAAVETVPGISAVGAAAAALSLPLAEGDEGLAILPLPRDLGRLDAVLAAFPNVALLKVGRRYGELYRYLEARGLAASAALACRLGQAGESVALPLPPPEEVAPDYFSLVIVKGGGAE